MNQELLILQFQKQDVQAYEKLYNAYCKSISGVINTIVKDAEVTEEITQDVFLKAWNNAASYSPSKGRFFTWLLNIARNAAIDYTRSKKYKQSQQNQTSDFFVDILETHDDLNSSTNAIGLKEMVEKLGDTCKSLIELLYFKGYTQVEASEELNMPLGTIKTKTKHVLGNYAQYWEYKMNIEEYIASGILELYVAGSLSEKENEEVYAAIQKYPELMAELESIENAILQLTAATHQGEVSSFDAIKNQLVQKESKVIPIQKPSNWKLISGWAAALLLGSVLVYNISQNNQSTSEIVSEKEALEAEIEKTKNSLAEKERLLEILRDKDIIAVPLAGQVASPNSYAKVYWNKKTNTIYLDAKGLPAPPKGKVYQVWSLKITPLTPTSLGTIDTFTANSSKVFAIENPNESEAFGITLEPAGGSSSPSLDQLYALGAVSS